MGQVHKRFTAEQVKVLLKGYCQGLLDRSAIEEVLGIGRSRFFALLKEYRHNPNRFSITYQRESWPRLPAGVEAEIEKELMLEKNLIDDSTLPIVSYNYSAIRDRLIKSDIRVSSPTIITILLPITFLYGSHRFSSSAILTRRYFGVYFDYTINRRWENATNI